MEMASAPQQLRILVADDSLVSRKLVEHALETEPYKLLFAGNGQEALQKVAEHRPDIVITDWMMPDLCGPDLCKAIRAQIQAGYTYIILLTSSSELERLVEGLAAGADDYVTKPFHSRELQARIGVGRRILAMHREIESKNKLLEEAAQKDHLTGLANRRALEEYAQRQLSGATRHKFPFWVLAADLDTFKSINDSYGHAAGDEVLKHFASMLKAETRASDFVARLGGDEFVLVVSHVEKGGVSLLIERLRAKFRAHDFGFDGNETHLGASFGFAGSDAPEDNMNFARLLADADAALYKVKAAERKPSEAQAELASGTRGSKNS
jgi:two-component system, cell cycle response regulator